MFAASSRPNSALYLNPVQLMGFTRFVAAEVAAGRYPYVQYDEAERWHQRLCRDRRVDVWLISWLPSQGTELHDHGGSSGAFTVLSGELAEAIPAGGCRLAERVRRAGDSVGFGPHYVHDVRNLGDQPAASVHAYSAGHRAQPPGMAAASGLGGPSVGSRVGPALDRGVLGGLHLIAGRRGVAVARCGCHRPGRRHPAAARRRPAGAGRPDPGGPGGRRAAVSRPR